MKLGSNTQLNKNSLFSNNAQTVMTNLHGADEQRNELHGFFKQLMSEFESSYPYLSKLLFLQLVLRENMTILSNRRAQIKDIWAGISSKIGLKSTEVYVMDGSTSIETTIKPKNQFHRILYYHLSAISNKSLNFMLNEDLTTLNILNVEDQQDKIDQGLATIFSLCFHDYKEENFEKFLEKIHEKPSHLPFNRQRFTEVIKINFSHAVKLSEEESFFKAYLISLKERISQKSIQLAHSKWKKMIRLLGFIGMTKLEESFKKISLTDCLLSPNLLASNLEELEIISSLNDEILLQLIPLTDSKKFLKTLKPHFWIPESTKQRYEQICEKLGNTVSFYYPCSKYPQTAGMKSDQGSLCYQIHGYEKKLMSDRYWEVDVNKEYELKLSIKTSNKMTLHVGLACFDEHKKFINAFQACRVEHSDVEVDSVQGNHIYIVEADQHKLKNWAVSKDQKPSFAYQKCIGIYLDGNLDQLLEQNQVLTDPNSYSENVNSGCYSHIHPNSIQLTDIGKDKLKYLSTIVPKKTKLMNHYEGGTYVIGCSQNKYFSEWESLKLKFQGEKRANNGNNFFIGTKYIRVIVMSNYNSGHPQYQIMDKEAKLMFRAAEWCSLP